MLKTHRFDLPPGIEKNCADWQKVVSATDYELTQAWAKFKKEVSVRVMFVVWVLQSLRTNFRLLPVSKYQRKEIPML